MYQLLCVFQESSHNNAEFPVYEQNQVERTVRQYFCGVSVPLENKNKEAIREVLSNLDTRVSVENKGTLEKHLEYSKGREALFSMLNGKASGLDGIPAELWKTFTTKFEKAEKESPNQNQTNSKAAKPPDIVELLSN
jgi:hypothetical protein